MKWTIAASMILLNHGFISSAFQMRMSLGGNSYLDRLSQPDPKKGPTPIPQPSPPQPPVPTGLGGGSYLGSLRRIVNPADSTGVASPSTASPSPAPLPTQSFNSESTDQDDEEKTEKSKSGSSGGSLFNKLFSTKSEETSTKKPEEPATSSTVSGTGFTMGASKAKTTKKKSQPKPKDAEKEVKSSDEPIFEETAEESKLATNSYFDELSKRMADTFADLATFSPSDVPSPAPRAGVWDRFGNYDPRNIINISNDGKTLSQRMMEKSSTMGQTGGAGGVSSWDAFLRAEDLWTKLKASSEFKYDVEHLRKVQNGVPPPPSFLTSDGAKGNPLCWEALRSSGGNLDYDIVVCGGTLGIFVGTALAQKGYRVAVIEGGQLRGREQEWNISMDELLELVKLGILTRNEIEEAITTKFDGCRAGFKNREAPVTGGYFSNGIGYECFIPDVLNLGVSPTILIELAADRFEYLGGKIIQQAPVKGICVSESDGVALDLGSKQMVVTSRIVLDCMGNASPISRQQRYGQQPDGICVVVGSCAGGYDPKTNINGDIIYTNTEIQNKGENGQQQYFWEAFPVGIGGTSGKAPGESDVKTTYMFSYLDAAADRPSLLSFMEDYWRLLPEYQPSINDVEQDLDIERVLFAFFPTYRDSPLPPSHSRILSVGDASGIQSPLSFGGFGALTRHLGRISNAVSDALDTDCLHKNDLGEINAYTPNLSAAWMFQRAMSIRMGQEVDPKFVNRLLATNFEVMNNMGPKTIKPFMQDVVRFDGLLGSLSGSFLKDPTFTPQIIQHVGLPVLIDWIGHVSMIGVYAGLHNFATPLVQLLLESGNWEEDDRGGFKIKRKMDAWKYGSGSDYFKDDDDWEEYMDMD